MSETVGDFLLERLRTWGVRRIYGYPGDGINGLMGAFGRSSNGRPEGRPSSSRCATRRWRPSWPAPTRSSPASSASAWRPRVQARSICSTASTTRSSTTSRWWRSSASRRAPGIGGNYQQEVDLTSLFKDVAHEYVQMAWSPAQIRHLDRPRVPDRTGRADRHLRSSSPTTFRRWTRCETPPHAHGTVHSGPGYSRAPVVPSDADLDRAAEVLNAGERVAMLVGAGALDAADEVVQVAEILGAGVAKALLGKAVLPDDLPYVTGSIGLLGTKPSWDDDAGVRHAADGRLELPVLGVPARGGPGARGADRHRRQDDRDPLPDGGQPDRRQRRDAARADPAAPAQERPLAGARRSRTRSPSGGS